MGFGDFLGVNKIHVYGQDKKNLDIKHISHWTSLPASAGDDVLRSLGPGDSTCQEQ